MEQKLNPLLILIATGQNWPNAISWEGLKDELDKKDPVRIYATPKMRFKARSLAKYMRVHHPIIHEAKSNSGEEFIDFLKGFPNERPLYVNLTGGTKLFWRALPYLFERGNAQIIYRDFDDNRWVEITSNGEEKSSLSITPEWVSNERPERLFLLQSEDENLTTEFKEDLGDPKSDLNQIQKALDNWFSGDMKPADAFELIICWSLRLLGMTVYHSLKLIGLSNERSLREVDVFAVDGAKPYMIECKLIDEDDERAKQSEIIAKLDTNSKLLSGLSTKTFLILPNLNLDEVLRQAAKNLDITVWGPKECQHLFTKLSELSNSSKKPEVNWEKLDQKFADILAVETGAANPIFDLREKLDRGLKEAKKFRIDHVSFRMEQLNFLWDGKELRRIMPVSKPFEAVSKKCESDGELCVIIPGTYLIRVPVAKANPKYDWFYQDRRSAWLMGPLPKEEEPIEFVKQKLKDCTLG